VYSVKGLSAATASIDWWVRFSRSARPTAPQMAIIGSCSVWSALRERDRTIATLDGEVEKRKELRPPSAAVMADDPRAR
jgi:hypothetical protein